MNTGNSNIVNETPVGGPEFKKNALKHISEWAARPPFFIKDNGVEQVVVGRYNDVQEVFTNAQVFSSAVPIKPGYEQFNKFMGSQFITQMDGEQHARLRRLLMPAFSTKRVNQIESAIVGTTEKLLDAISEKGPEFDAMQDYAAKLVVGVLLHSMMNLNDEQSQALLGFQRAWRLLDKLKPGDLWPEALVTAYESARKVVQDLIAERRASTLHSDFLQDLVSARFEDQKLSDQELFDLMLGILSALGTVPRSTAGALFMLYSHPDQLEQIKADMSLLPDAIDECFRRAGNGYFTFPRITTTETELGGVKIPKGIIVRPSPMAANLDPTVFERPFEFDIHRKPAKIMTFGAGPHRCPGNILGRKTVITAICMLIERFPNARLARQDFTPVYEGATGELRMRELPLVTG